MVKMVADTAQQLHSGPSLLPSPTRRTLVFHEADDACRFTSSNSPIPVRSTRKTPMAPRPNTKRDYFMPFDMTPSNAERNYNAEQHPDLSLPELDMEGTHHLDENISPGTVLCPPIPVSVASRLKPRLTLRKLPGNTASDRGAPRSEWALPTNGERALELKSCSAMSA